MNKNEELLVSALAKNPDFIKWFWSLADGFVNNTTINDNWQARAGYEALSFMDPIIRAAQAQVIPIPEGKSPQFEDKECEGCHTQFRTNTNSDKCYNCTLEDITHGMPPEEGDFNTARINSGTMTTQERAWLQKDLEAVENGGTVSSFYLVEYGEEYPEDEDDGWVYDEREDAKWGHEG
ncbi:MAG: hypothetical protein A2919_01135 [Candidatus Spechtbacteria bacterium RIFCSPLOWO2_01_FULL_43_12]|uniref:Uncharacterized protein n=1 Tax=Candidatus Spechtbacteria bacterium RIFCSPLOWO2_01_FULL_43_12 TaxID=1802162 RepID=A0A1G2HE33_9BACT|nr:MAG: hypothetical protein A2919_01135 [Candidatus Spechtbacteria bacterium RIFCSPLOWO2_01_FULL_43_12]